MQFPIICECQRACLMFRVHQIGILWHVNCWFKVFSRNDFNLKETCMWMWLLFSWQEMWMLVVLKMSPCNTLHLLPFSIPLEHHQVELEQNKLSRQVLLFLPDVIGYEGYEILKLHDADPALGMELKFTAISSCRRFLESYRCGLLRQALHQHSSRLLVRPEDLNIQMQLKAATHTLDLCLNDLECCLTYISTSQVHSLTISLYTVSAVHGTVPSNNQSVTVSVSRKW